MSTSIFNIIPQIVAALSVAIAALFSPIQQSIENAIGNVFNKTSNIETTIGQKITDVLMTITAMQNAINSTITGEISSQTQAIENQLNTTTSTIENSIANETAKIDSALKATTGAINSNIAASNASITSTLSNVNNSIVSTIGNTATQTMNFITGVENKLANYINAGVSATNNLINGVEEKISTAISGATNYISSTVQNAQDLITEKITDVADLITSIPDGFRKALNDVFQPSEIDIDAFTSPAVIGSLGFASPLTGVLAKANAMPTFFKTILGMFILRDIFIELKQASFQPILEKLRQEVSMKVREGLLDYNSLAVLLQKGVIDESKVNEIMSRAGLDNEQIEAIKQITEQYLSLDVLSDASIKGFISQDDAIKFAKKQGYSEKDVSVLQELRRQYLSINDLVVAHIRHGLPLDYVVEIATKHGFSQESVEIAKVLQTNLLTENDLRDLFLRGLLDDEELNKQMSRLGWTQENTDKIKELYYFIPSPNDLIHMAVREAFTPDVAAKFGQYEDFPQDFAKYAKMQGMSEEWAKAFWAAHWELPSPSQGFEMFQRRIIDEETLNMLLRALDVMPFWRDKLIKMNYNVMTRVDVRRMWELGIIDLDEVERRLGDMGYSPDDAKLMKEYYLIEKEYAMLAEKAEGRNLSKAETLSAYSNGIISRSEAFDNLTNLHYNDEEIEIFLQMQEYKDEKALRDRYVKLAKEKYLVGIITFNEAIDEIGKLNLTAIEQEKILLDFELDIVPKTKLPRIDDLLLWGKNGIISLQEMEQEIIKQGYHQKYAANYRKQIEGGKK